jgi:hypothetical protein
VLGQAKGFVVRKAAAEAHQAFEGSVCHICFHRIGFHYFQGD